MGGKGPEKPTGAQQTPKKAPETSDRLKELEAKKKAIMDNAKARLEGLNNTFKEDLSGRYAQRFDAIMKDVEPDLEGDDNPENPVWRKARGIALKAIESEIEGAQKKAGKFIKRDVVHEFAEALLKDYVDKMDAKAEQFAFNIGVLHADELDVQKNPDMMWLKFEDWLGYPPRYPDEALYDDLDMKGAQEFASDVGKVGAELAKIGSEGLDEKFDTYFKAERAKIQNHAVSSPNAAKESLKTAQELIKSYEKALGISKVLKDLDARLNDVAGLKEKVSDLDPSIEDGYKQEKAKVEKLIDDFVKSGKSSLDYEVKVILEIDKKVEAAKVTARQQSDEQQKATEAAEAQEVQEAAQPPDPFEDPDGFLMHMGNEMGPFGKLFIGLMAGSPFFAKLKTHMSIMKGKYGLEGAKKEAPQIGISLTFMNKKFGFTSDEAFSFCNMDVAELLNMQRSPSGVRQKPFENFVESMKRNGATVKTPGTVARFLSEHHESWKDE
ncbi:MAG TPA: hypothetical protein PKA32_00930 [Candidatus Gracilibacteria bacterium]|nr:hypothetical protein [Candidatus Gracilibacteria bacterium]